MNPHWEYAEAALQAIGWPDSGDATRWCWWFRRTWAQLDELDWFAPENGFLPSDHGGLTLFTLRWIVEDFCAEATGERDFYVPYWDDWLDAVAVNPGQLLEAAERLPEWAEVREALEAESGLDDAEDDDERAASEGEIASAAPVQAALLLSVRLRRRLVPVLWRAWGNEFRFFAGLWACCGGEAADEVDVEEEDEATEKRDGTAQLLLWEVDAPLGKAGARAVNERAQVAFTDPILIEDEESMARLNTVEWVTNGCPVRVAGCPVTMCEWD